MKKVETLTNGKSRLLSDFAAGCPECYLNSGAAACPFKPKGGCWQYTKWLRGRRSQRLVCPVLRELLKKLISEMTSLDIPEPLARKIAGLEIQSLRLPDSQRAQIQTRALSLLYNALPKHKDANDKQDFADWLSEMRNEKNEERK